MEKLKAVYPYVVGRDRYLLLVEEEDKAHSFSKTVVPCEDATQQDRLRHYYYKEGYLRPHRVLGGRLSSKYAEEDRETLENAGLKVLWNGDEWITDAKNRADIPRLRTGITDDFRPREIGAKPDPYRRGHLGSPDYINGSRSLD